MKQADAILTADWHLRDTVPLCRKDDYWAAQEKKIKFIIDLSQKHVCPIYHAGDIFDKPKSSPFLEAWAINQLSSTRNLITCPGNHDLPNHNLNLLAYSSLQVLKAGNGTEILTGDKMWYSGVPDAQLYSYPWGTTLTAPPGHPRASEGVFKVALVHHLVTKQDKDPWPGAEADQGKRLLKKFKDYDLILTGHNHKSFVVEYQNRLLVNPGSMMRMSASQLNYKPRVYLWYAKENKVEKVYLPIEKDVVTREHIELQEKRDERMEVFVSRLNDDYEIGLSFEKNLRSFFEQNRVKKSVKSLTWEMVESNEQSQR